MRLRLNRLRAVGTDVEPAEVDFGDGLTVISGASNTGKSYIRLCLYYLLGGQEPPKTVRGNGPYHTLLLEISTGTDPSSKSFTIQRQLKIGGPAAVHECPIDSWTPELKGTAVPVKHNAKNDQNLSRILLRLCGSDNTMIRAKSTSVRMMTFAELKRFLLIDETMIIGDYSPIFPGCERGDMPVDKAVFGYLISGQDATGAVVLPNVTIEKAKWKAQTELIDNWISEISSDISAMVLPTAAQITLNETRHGELLAALDQRSVSIDFLNSDRRSEWEALRKFQARHDIVQQLLYRFELLREHYASDVERLTFVAEGEFLLSQLGEVKCPLCQSRMAAPTIDAVPTALKERTIQRSCAAERIKIEKNIADLDVTVSELGKEQQGLAGEIAACQSRMQEIERTINQELHPAVAALRQELDELALVRQGLAVADSLRSRLQSLQDMKKALGLEPKRSRSKGSTVGVGVQQKSLRVFSDEVERLLRAWHFRNAGTAEFSEKMDLVVNGESRLSQGKGYRAVMYAAFTIALMNTSNDRHPQFVVIDSPLTSYKENDNYKVDDDLIRGFYESLIATSKNQQIIIIENQDPPDDLVLKMHHHHFSGEGGMGRTGFYPIT